MAAHLRYPLTCYIRFRPDGEETQLVEPTRNTMVAFSYFYPDIESQAEQVQVLIDFLHGHEFISMEEAKRALSMSKWYEEFETEIVESAKQEAWESDIGRAKAFRYALKDTASREFTPKMMGKKSKWSKEI